MPFKANNFKMYHSDFFETACTNNTFGETVQETVIKIVEDQRTPVTGLMGSVLMDVMLAIKEKDARIGSKTKLFKV